MNLDEMSRCDVPHSNSYWPFLFGLNWGTIFQLSVVRVEDDLSKVGQYFFVHSHYPRNPGCGDRSV